jgi:hypothetical protein
MRQMNQHDPWDDAIEAFSREQNEKSDPLPDYVAREQFQERNPWPIFRAQLDQRYERHVMKKRLNWTMGFSALGLAASTAIVLMLVAPTHLLTPQSPVSPEIRAKGSQEPAATLPGIQPALEMQMDGQFIAAGSTLQPLATVKLFVTTGTYDHVLVFGVEQSGRLTPYYPEQPNEGSLLVGKGRGLPLPDAIELDDSLGTERFVAIFSSRPLTWARVREAASQAFTASGARLNAMGKIELPNTEEASIWFVKRQSR